MHQVRGLKKGREPLITMRTFFLFLPKLTCCIPDLERDPFAVLEFNLLCDKVGADRGLVCIGEPLVDKLLIFFPTKQKIRGWRETHVSFL